MTRARRLLISAGLAVVFTPFGLILILSGTILVQRSGRTALPAPSGSFLVGRAVYDWVDAKRVDSFSDSPNRNRELPIWIWYPSKADPSVRRSPYWTKEWIEAEKTAQGLGIYLEYKSENIETHCADEAPLSEVSPSYPVVIMGPGMGRSAVDYTSFALNLASHGFVVVGVSPTYSADAVAFSDGRVVPRSAKGSISEDLVGAGLDEASVRIEAVWIADVAFVADRIEALNKDSSSLFFKKLDLGRLGVFGHSFGGITALSFCAQDARCVAAADLDGTPNSHDKTMSVQKPFMFITEDYSADCDENCRAINDVYAAMNPAHRYLVSIAGTRHMNYSDVPLQRLPVLQPLLRGLGVTGSIEPRRAVAVTNAYLVDFFDAYLNKRRPGLLNLSAVYPEAHLAKN